MDTSLPPEPPAAESQTPSPEATAVAEPPAPADKDPAAEPSPVGSPSAEVPEAAAPETVSATAEAPAGTLETPAEVAAASPPPPIELPPIPVDLSRVAQDLQIRKVQVEAVVQLLDEGNTIPFIARYRKEKTHGLPEEIVRRVRHRVNQLRNLADRKRTILKSMANHGRLTDELREEIIAAENPKRLEDLYLPYKPRKRSSANEAREKGLEPLALAIWDGDPAAGNLDELLPTVVDPEKGLATADDVMNGVGQILGESIAERAPLRGVLRMVLWDTGRLTVTKSETLAEGKGNEYKDYFQFTESIRHIPPHRVLAINRGEKENALKVKLDFDQELLRRVALDRLPLADHPHRERLLPIVEDALTRLVVPSLEREIRRDLTERAQDHAVAVFARNLRSLLLQRPLTGKRILAIDPGFRTGCRVAAIDESGEVLDHAVIHPHQPQKKLAESRHKLEELIRNHRVDVIAIGNGTASRDTEELVAGLIAEFEARRRGEFPPPSTDPPAPAPSVVSEVSAVPVAETAPLVAAPPSPSFAFSFTEAPPQVPHSAAGEPPPPSAPGAAGEGFSLTSETPPAFAAPPPAGPPAETPQPSVVLPPLDGLPEPSPDLAYVIVNEAGASDYATSPPGREEFPHFDAALRSTVSIGRRLQDPLRELVKIDPQHVGVGLYQHDVHPKHLREALTEVIESCVNHVGVDVNSAGVSLLRHVSGLNPSLAREVVEYRRQHGPFAGREALKQVAAVGENPWTQAAGFLKFVEPADPLDVTWIHPESYGIARQLLGELGFDPDVLRRVTPDHPLVEALTNVSADQVAAKHHVGPATIRDIIAEFARPGRDPREDLPPPVFKRAVLQLEDLRPGMELKGTVLNVVPFGAFIDVGLKDSGLVHISQMANRYIKSPHEVVAVGDVVTVWVLNVDADRKRASLTMIPPGTERKPPERRAARPERSPGESRPAGRREGGPQRHGPRPPQRNDRRPPSSAETPPKPGEQQPAAPPRPPRQLPERKPPKPRPLPQLTQAKKEGKEYLTTLGELAAFFKAREDPRPADQPPPAEG